MKYNEIHNMTQKPEPKPDTYEAGMAQNQLLKIGTHAIKIHNMIDDDAEMEAWVAKKIDLASNYVKSVHGYTAGSKAGTYDDGGMTEDAPFDGMGLVRMALMRKFITAEEWHGLKDKWKDAVEELEQKYDDWPEDQGFGSSDHNYAIKELMGLVGYKFDDQDTSGRFVVSKMPPELEKMGIKNSRMKDAVTTGEDADIDAQMKVDILQFLNTKVAGIERQIEMKPAFTQEDIDNKEFTLKLIDFVQKKLDDKQKGD